MESDLDSCRSTDELVRLRRRVRDLERLLDLREQELDAVVRSHSFRLMAPLRWLRRKMEGKRSPASDMPTKVQMSAAPGLPRGVLREEDASDPNASHRVLDLDEALQPLIPEVRDGALRKVPVGRACYRGFSPAPVRIATIVSRELGEELSFDTEVTAVPADDWTAVIRPGAFDLLLIEASWQPDGGWEAGFPGTERSRDRLRKLIAHCRASKLAVVLWARENSGALDRVAWLADEADKTYAVDQEGHDWLRKHVPTARLGLMAPAIQPRLYNPVRSYDLKACHQFFRETVLLDGWWDLAGPWTNSRVPESLGDRLRVVDSCWDYSRIRVQDNPGVAARSLGVVTPLEKSALLRSGATEVVLQGGFRPAWRQTEAIMRALASGALTLWPEENGQGPEEMFGKSVVHTSARTVESDLKQILAAPLTNSRRSHLAMRDVMLRHSIADRLQQILDDLGIGKEVVQAPPKVAHLLVSMRPELLPACLERFRRDRYQNRELVVVLHGRDESLQALRSLLKPGEPVTFLRAAQERSLGDCLNLAIASTDAPIWMKIDDDDHYGANYTADMMLYHRMTDAALLGKPPMFLHLEGEGKLYWDPDRAAQGNLLHDASVADSAPVAGGTLTGKREVLEQVPFSSVRRGGSDTEFVRRAYGQGFSLVTADGFNFARFRSGKPGFHTWRMASGSLQKRATVIGSTDDIADHVFV